MMLFHGNLEEQPYAGDPDDLLDQLGGCRDECFFQAVKVTVDAGVDGGKRDREGKNLEERGAPGLFQKMHCGQIGKAV